MVLRAPVHYYGGKGNLRKKLRPLIPYTKIYCEPYCGAGTILVARAPSPVEVLNDLNGSLITCSACSKTRANTPSYVTGSNTPSTVPQSSYGLSPYSRMLGVVTRTGAWAIFANLNQGYSGTGGQLGQQL